MKLISLLCAWSMVIGSTLHGRQPALPARVLLITGHNNHNWRYTSRLHKDTLEATGRFIVDITDEPSERLTSAGAMLRYKAFILDYNDFGDAKRWGDVAEQNFLNAVSNGAGVVALHSANNAFAGWNEYEKMLGLMWREGAGHGSFHRFGITMSDREHPITQGLEHFVQHPDELYHRLVNVHSGPHQVLATANSSLDFGGTGQDEPMVIVLNYGKGRIFATPLGHVWTNEYETKLSISDPQFKILLCRGAEWAATGTVTLGTTWSDRREHNRLTPEEISQGWELLFTGTVADKFRGFKQEGFPQTGWSIRDNTLVHAAGEGGGDLITVDEFGNFEFTCQWKAAVDANSGIIYRCNEDQAETWHSGPEMQILDDTRHQGAASARNRAGALYDLMPCAFDVARPPGEWNEARIVANGSKIQHWLNGFKVIECDLESPEYKELRTASKFEKFPEFAKRLKGHIALQDHGDEVCYRNIKVRRLP